MIPPPVRATSSSRHRHPHASEPVFGPPLCGIVDVARACSEERTRRRSVTRRSCTAAASRSDQRALAVWPGNFRADASRIALLVPAAHAASRRKRQRARRAAADRRLPNGPGRETSPDSRDLSHGRAPRGRPVGTSRSRARAPAEENPVRPGSFSVLTPRGLLFSFQL